MWSSSTPTSAVGSALKSGERPLRPAAISAWVARWSGLLAVAAQRALAASLLELLPTADLGDGPGPSAARAAHRGVLAADCEARQ